MMPQRDLTGCQKKSSKALFFSSDRSDLCLHRKLSFTGLDGVSRGRCSQPELPQPRGSSIGLPCGVACAAASHSSTRRSSSAPATSLFPAMSFSSAASQYSSGPLAPGEHTTRVERERHREGLRLPRRLEHRPVLVARQRGENTEVALRRGRGGHPRGPRTRCRARGRRVPTARVRRSARCNNAGVSCRASWHGCRGR